ncbi:MAG: VOC family protein [Planctomycetes bacterium]|nr:VOC family protein [Planctomycetota bacterium]
MAEEGKPAYGIGSFMWHECWTRDLAKAKDFWGKVAGWKFEEMDMGPGGKYNIIMAGDKTVGGMAALTAEWGEMPSHWGFYIDVEDVDSALAKAKELGGEPKHDVIDVPNVGRFCPVGAPDGSVVYLMTPAHRATEAPCAEPGTFLWVELMSRDFAKAKEFYTKLLGWQAQEMPMPDGVVYNVFSTGNGHAGGGMQMPAEVPAEVPSNWTGYIHVADLDKTLETVKGEGGQVIVPPMEVPNVGRMAHIMDPAGAAVALMTPAQMQ